MVVDGSQRIGLKRRVRQHSLKLGDFHISYALPVLSGHLGTLRHFYSLGLLCTFPGRRNVWIRKIESKDTEVPKSSLFDFDGFCL